MVDVANRIQHAAPALYKPPTQNINGSALEAASKVTIDSNAQLASMAKSLGAGQKGASRRRRSKKRKVKRGGASLNASSLNLPSAKSMPGVDADSTHVKIVDLKNQFGANAVGDKDINAPPAIVGGKRRTRKAKNGHRRHRTHRRSRK